MESEKSRHHRCPKSRGGSNEPPNTIKVPHKKHEAWHVVFGNKSPEEIVQDLNNIWFYPDYEVVLKRRNIPPNETYAVVVEKPLVKTTD